ncbi:MAG: hypothetical protein U1D30_26080 [Planctomycetota bacterium]
MPLAYIHENTTAYLTVSFQDKTGTPAVPTAILYRLDCISNGREIADWTTITSPSSTIELTLSPLQNCIYNTSRRRELRSLQVIATYGPGDQIHAEFRFEVINLREPFEPVLVVGDDYLDADGRALQWTGGGGWPPLLDATIDLTLAFADTLLTVPAVTETPTGPNKLVRVSLSSTQTGPLPSGRDRYSLVASFPSGRTATLAAGTINVVER